jgi:tetratricopeptide (TPR) repeat protein
MLVILDNARSPDQVRPLLPGSGACTVVVTSRDSLAGLVSRDGAARLDLDVLSRQDAITLLRTLIGARVDTEPAAAELAEQCCRLPLALRVAAELAASRPPVPLADLTAELADLGTRLDRLDARGDPRTQVRAVFSWSYRYLDTGTARTFRLIGLHPGPDLDPYAAAALTGTTVQRACRALDALTRANLIQAAGQGRHGMHDLLRAYARDLTAAQDAEAEHAALTRLFDYYLHTAAAAMDTLFPAERHRRPRIRRPTTPVPPLTDPAAARDWLDAGRAALVAAAGHAAAHDWPDHAMRLAATISRYLRNGGHFPQALTVYDHALGAARRTGDRAAEARTLGYVGLNETQLGRYEQAARHQQEALVIFRDIGDRFGQARALGNLGWVRQRQGRYQEASSYQQQTLNLSRGIGDSDGEGNALARLGVIDLRLERYQHAEEYLQQALALFQKRGSTVGEVEILVRLGEVYLGIGHCEQAAANFEQARVALREIGDPDLEASALNGLGDVLFRSGEPGKARAHHATALRLASEIGSPLEQARAHSGLARAYHADGDSLQARHHWQEALTRFAAVGAPEADQASARSIASCVVPVYSATPVPPRRIGQGADATPHPPP